MEKTLRDRIDGIIQTQLGVDADKVTPEAKLDDDLGADSLDVVELVMRLEEEFRVEISDDNCERWSTVEDVHTSLDKLLSERSGA